MTERRLWLASIVKIAATIVGAGLPVAAAVCAASGLGWWVGPVTTEARSS